MVKVCVGNNVKRDNVIVDSNVTLRSVLEDANIDYTKGTNHHVGGSHYVKCTDEELRKWTK